MNVETNPLLCPALHDQALNLVYDLNGFVSPSYLVQRLVHLATMIGANKRTQNNYSQDVATAKGHEIEGLGWGSLILVT